MLDRIVRWILDRVDPVQRREAVRELVEKKRRDDERRWRLERLAEKKRRFDRIWR